MALPFSPFSPGEDALPPEEVRFTDFHIEPWPEGLRLRVHARLTPFKQPPNLETVLSGPDGNEVASTLIVENVDTDLVFTMHIRGEAAPGDYSIHCQIVYTDVGVVDTAQADYNLPETPPE